MKKQKLVKILIILLIIIIALFLLFNIIIKFKFNYYINNTIKYLDKVNYDSIISLNIKSSEQESNISYTMKKSNGVTSINYKQYKDENIINNTMKYFVTKADNITCYTKLGNNWNSEKVDKIEKIFYPDYSKLKSMSYSVKYLGKKVINDKKHLMYSIKMDASLAYNMIYKKDVLDKKDINKKVNVIVYIESDTNIIGMIKYKIDNINNVNDDKYKLSYNIEIINKNINNNNLIKLPFEK